MPHSTPAGVDDEISGTEWSQRLWVTFTNTVTDGLRRQSQLSSIGKAAIMSNVVVVENPNDNHSNKETREIKITSHGLVPPPHNSYGRVIQTIPNGHSCGPQDGGSHTPSDASGGSAPSTAPSSPHLLVSAQKFP
jgi:hypothetical protein